MYIVLLKKDNRVTSLALGVHGENLQELEQYAKANFEYDKAVKMDEMQHAQMLENEAKANEMTKEEIKTAKELARLEAETVALENEISELKDAYVLASMLGDEELKEEIRADYLELTGMEIGDLND